MNRFLCKSLGSRSTPVCLSGLSNKPVLFLFPPLRTMKLAFSSLWVYSQLDVLKVEEDLLFLIQVVKCCNRSTVHCSQR